MSRTPFYLAKQQSPQPRTSELATVELSAAVLCPLLAG